LEEVVGIPSEQLETWSNRPDPSRSASTYAAIRDGLSGARRLGRYGPDIYLQGSYANATNIRADSDVDIVCQLTSSWRRDIDYLSTDEQLRYHGAFTSSDLSWTAFRLDVLAVLRENFGSAVISEGSKCIKVSGSSSRLRADVLVAQEYRLYLKFPSQAEQSYVEGVTFWTSDGQQVINYPKFHRTFGQTKHAETGERYKGLVRTFKNARRRAVEDGLLTHQIAPSYFVECLLYNLPNEQINPTSVISYLDSLVWLSSHMQDYRNMKCQNRITSLFGPDPVTQWRVDDARYLVLALLKQWNSW
jgi:hypothetical protein